MSAINYNLALTFAEKDLRDNWQKYRIGRAAKRRRTTGSLYPYRISLAPRLQTKKSQLRSKGGMIHESFIDIFSPTKNSRFYTLSNRKEMTPDNHPTSHVSPLTSNVTKER